MLTRRKGKTRPSRTANRYECHSWAVKLGFDPSRSPAVASDTPAASIQPLPRIRFHDLRHSAASLLLAQGVPLRMIMEQLGHSSIALTANTYAHVMPTAMREVADKMELILGAQEG
jgi:integrase